MKLIMHIPFHKPYITDDEINAAADAMRNGWLTMGRKTFEFEGNFAAYIGCKNSIAVNSCTAALHLALEAIGLQEGDEVILPALTFAATAEVVRYFNAIPVVADVNSATYNIDVREIEKKITAKTKAVIPVHFSGQPADLDEIHDIASKNKLFIIEDAAHSLPAAYKGTKIGNFPDITCFSFYATKTITTGEGGMITTANDEYAERMKLLRLHGISRDAWKRYTGEGSWRYDVYEAGYKYNMTDIAAAIGIEQLKRIDLLQGLREKIAERYNEALKDNEAFELYHVENDRTTSWHLYPVKINIDRLTISRDQFIDKLKERSIVVSVHFIPLYRFTYYSDLLCTSSGKNAVSLINEFPASEYIFARTISLPIFPGMTDEEVDYVVNAMTDIAKENHR
jgi:dTDP-4-amino-4,6-dideoxygalactose transaminase